MLRSHFTHHVALICILNSCVFKADLKAMLDPRCQVLLWLVYWRLSKRTRERSTEWLTQLYPAEVISLINSLRWPTGKPMDPIYCNEEKKKLYQIFDWI